ncbi:MAG: thioredoxin family protein [Thermoanaerobaculia bacterium]
MNRIPVLATLVVALALAPQVTEAGKWHDTVAKAQAEAKKGNKLILVDMFADWCGWCHRMEREVFPSEVFQAASKNYALLRLDTEDGKEGTKVASDFGVTSLPTFLLLTPDLGVAGYIRGYSAADAFVEKIQQAETDYFSFQKRVRGESKKASDSDRLSLTIEMIGRRDFTRAEPRLASLTKSKDAAIRDESYHQLATMHALQRKWDRAEATLKEALGINRRGAIAERNQMMLAQVYMSTKNYPAAVAELKRFKSSYPNSELISRVEVMLPQLERQIPRN